MSCIYISLFQLFHYKIIFQKIKIYLKKNFAIHHDEDAKEALRRRKRRGRGGKKQLIEVKLRAEKRNCEMHTQYF